MRILIAAFVAPRPHDPSLGASVRRRALALTKAGHRVDVLVPVRVFPDTRLLRALAKPARWRSTASSARAWSALWRGTRGERVDDGVRYIYRRFTSLPATSRAGGNAESFLRSQRRWLASRFVGAGYDLVLGQFMETAPLVRWLAAASAPPASAGPPGAVFAAEDLDQLAVHRGEEQVRRLLTLVPLLLVHGPRVARQIRARLQPSPRIAIVPHPLDPEFLRAPASLPPPADCLRLVCVSRFFDLKNQQLVLAAADRWKRLERAPALHLELAGDRGPVRPALEAEIRRRGLAQQVVITTIDGSHDVAAALRRAHALVLPSRCESFSVAALEALALGLPVLAGPEIGIRDEMARRGWDPLPLFDVDSVESLIAAIEELAADYSHCRRRAVDLRSKVVVEFSEAAFVESLLSATALP